MSNIGDWVEDIVGDELWKELDKKEVKKSIINTGEYAISDNVSLEVEKVINREKSVSSKDIYDKHKEKVEDMVEQEVSMDLYENLIEDNEIYVFVRDSEWEKFIHPSFIHSSYVYRVKIYLCKIIKKWGNLCK